jgi:hypothetical protein
VILIAADLASHAAGVPKGTLRVWALRKHITRHPCGRYDLEEIQGWLDRRDTRMIRGRASLNSH